MDKITIREIGGEIWAAITEAQQSQSSHALNDIPWNVSHQLSEFVMSILARHIGKTLVDDEGLPVDALPNSE